MARCGGDTWKEFLVCAAIDFGTTYSGYAFSTLNDFTSDPTKCSTFHWTSGCGNFVSMKTSTCVLFDEKKRFSAFGFEAEEKYANLALERKHPDWYFFRRFKMKLYEERKLKRDFNLEGDSGKTMPAMTVFSAAIKYLKNHMVKNCKTSGILTENDILFVLTVPAIWTDPAKQFMREAAINAGIDNDHLVIALEPEAASLFCQHVPALSSKMVDDRNPTKMGVFKSGSKYIVIDAGGGTIDITVHSVQRSGHIQEVHRANGGYWGGTRVDEAFVHLLSDIVGEKVINNFAKKNKYDVLELSTSFEVRKRNIKPDTKDKVMFKVPISLNEAFEKQNEQKSIRDALPMKYNRQVTWMGDKMQLDPELARNLFRSSINHITDHLKELMKHKEVREASHILMVGGYSESPMLRDAIIRTFSDKQVFSPQEAGLAVLKGAVIFGHQYQSETLPFKYRVAKFTYGISTNVPFIDHVHDETKRISTRLGEDHCKDVFSKHVEIGDKIEVGAPQKEETYGVLYRKQKNMSFEVFTSKKSDPMYVTDSDCVKLGRLDIETPGSGTDRSVTVSMTFSDTEIHIEAVNDQNGERISTSFDLLG